MPEPEQNGGGGHGVSSANFFYFTQDLTQRIMRVCACGGNRYHLGWSWFWGGDVKIERTETFQVQTSNIYKRQTLSGEFLLVNRHLVKELSKRNLWNKEMRDNIILENGSVQNISKFPEDLKEIYKTVWETSQRTVIDMAADRAPFIDQTQSMNLWLSNPTFGKVNSMHMYAWKKGLKTGMYYLRSRSAVDAVKVTVSSEKKDKEKFLNKNKTDATEECLTCTA